MGKHQRRSKKQRTIKNFLKMELTIVKVNINRRGRVKAKLQMDYEDSQEMELGEYALVKIESLNDKIAVEKFIEQLRNK
jgi:hypothetical protein